MCVAPIRAGACNTLSHRRMPENCGDTNTISFTCLRFRSFSKGGLVFVNSQNHLRCREPEATLLFGYLFELARKKQPSFGSVAKLCPAVSNISRGLHQFFGGLLSALLRCKNHAGLDQEHRALSGQNRPLRLPRRPYSGCRAAFFASSSVISSATALRACSSLV
jgi:hypothetical protein